MRIFDAHMHVDKGLDSYNLVVDGRNIIFNYVDEYKTLATIYPGQKNTSITLIFDFKNNLDFVIDEIEKCRVKAIKIHSRIQELFDADYSSLIVNLAKVKEHIPVVIDAFYFGTPLKFQPDLGKFIEIIEKYPEKKFIIAHSGGYEILKYFFHLRQFENVTYELSFSLQYLADSSVFPDLKKLIRYTDPKKIIFGSDFPFGDPLKQFDILNKILKEINFSYSDKENIFYKNASQLYLHDSI